MLPRTLLLAFVLGGCAHSLPNAATSAPLALSELEATRGSEPVRAGAKAPRARKSARLAPPFAGSASTRHVTPSRAPESATALLAPWPDAE